MESRYLFSLDKPQIKQELLCFFKMLFLRFVEIAQTPLRSLHILSSSGAQGNTSNRETIMPTQQTQQDHPGHTPNVNTGSLQCLHFLFRLFINDTL